MGFRQFHTLDLTGWSGGRRDRRAGQLLQAIERRLKDKSGGKAAASAPAPSLPRKGTSELRKHPCVVGDGRGGGDAYRCRRGVALLEWPRAHCGFGFQTDHWIAAIHHGSFRRPTRNARRRCSGFLAHTLSQSGVPVRLLGSRPPDSRSAGDFLISGEMSRNADKIVATIHLDEAAHGVTVYSKRFEAGPRKSTTFRIGSARRWPECCRTARSYWRWTAGIP